MIAKRRKWLRALPILPLLVACGATQSVDPPRSAASGAAPTPTPQQAGLYGAEEALRDALSGPLVHVGTGPWPGNSRMHACAFRNERVLVVNVYCGIRDTEAFRLDVYSPARGHVRIYAESNGPISGHVRNQYFTFTAASEPPPGPETHVPALDLHMSFGEIDAYEQARYAAYLPACYGGIERNEQRNGCLGPLASEIAAWGQQNGAFLERASDDWYRIVRELRALATQYGRDPK
jgi:hypothetical protein